MQDLTIDDLRYDDTTTLADCSADERNVVCKSMEMPFPIGVTLVSGRRIVATSDLTPGCAAGNISKDC